MNELIKHKAMRASLLALALAAMCGAGVRADDSLSKSESYAEAMNVLRDPSSAFEKVRRMQDVDALRVVAFTAHAAAYPMEAGPDREFDDTMHELGLAALHRLFQIDTPESHEAIELYRTGFPVDGAVGLSFKEWGAEAAITRRMKEMMLPSFDFTVKPVKLSEAIEAFREMSVELDDDDSELPREKRGFLFRFCPDGTDDPVIPKMSACGIAFYEALKFVCESVDYTFGLEGSVIVVRKKPITTIEKLVAYENAEDVRVRGCSREVKTDVRDEMFEYRIKVVEVEADASLRKQFVEGKTSEQSLVDAAFDEVVAEAVGERFSTLCECVIMAKEGEDETFKIVTEYIHPAYYETNAFTGAIDPVDFRTTDSGMTVSVKLVEKVKDTVLTSMTVRRVDEPEWRPSEYGDDYPLPYFHVQSWGNPQTPIDIGKTNVILLWHGDCKEDEAYRSVFALVEVSTVKTPGCAEQADAPFGTNATSR